MNLDYALGFRLKKNPKNKTTFTLDAILFACCLCSAQKCVPLAGGKSPPPSKLHLNKHRHPLRASDPRRVYFKYTELIREGFQGTGAALALTFGPLPPHPSSCRGPAAPVPPRHRLMNASVPSGRDAPLICLCFTAIAHLVSESIGVALAKDQAYK